MHKQKGLASITVLGLLLVAVSLTGVGIYVYDSNRSNDQESAQTPPGSGKPVPGSILITFVDGTDHSKITDIVRKSGGQIIRFYESLGGIAHVSAPEGKEQLVINALIKWPEIKSAEQDMAGCMIPEGC